MERITREEFSEENVRVLFEKDTRHECQKYFSWSGINKGYLPWIIVGYRVCKNRMRGKIELACNKYPDLRELFEEGD